MDRPEAAAASSDHEPALASLSKSWGQRIREWRFRPMGLEPTPELAAVAVGVCRMLDLEQLCPRTTPWCQ